jgi:hypothetical protein
VECIETILNTKTKVAQIQKFTYITNIRQNKDNVVTTADSGRLRWKIENEGFNTQKNSGYGLEHKYSRISYPAMQNYYHILQIAHAINQLVERKKEVVEIIGEHSKQTIVDLWKKLIAFMIMVYCPETSEKPNLYG